MKKDILILLPDTIYINKLLRNQDIGIKTEEYNIYFKNIIHPFNPMWDIQVICKYGKNHGDMWRLTNYLEDEDEFDFELVIYDEYGEKVASKKSRVVMAERKPFANETTLLAIGDSMTRSQIYIEAVLKKLYNMKTVGTRSFSIMAHEGRGGWAYKQYLGAWTSVWGGVSPFLFPKGIDDYYGNMEFMNIIKDPNRTTYAYDGFTYEPIKDGQYFTENEKLYQLKDGKNILVSENPEFEPDFGKYLKRYNIKTPDVVSILMGANDLQICPYEESHERIEQYIANTKTMVDAIHRADKSIKVIINLPVLGAEQYCWGSQLGCVGSEKMYRFNIMNAGKRLLEEFDNKQSENIFISPMIMCLDTVNGFDNSTVKANVHSTATEVRQSNWVHPNNSGYYQMGDALASVIEYIR